ncbi:hypothetical protein BpHYR1_016493 [Brachionus plicatilis]|uniref:Secreted protein n=1 Tax=Brachionus plicatilis TaxID=10195 RepID=A0A3M7T531_BRAPC|nr:hypothetical protein BpHYR1_016493 [Brachionus plicatilis]
MRSATFTGIALSLIYQITLLFKSSSCEHNSDLNNVHFYYFYYFFVFKKFLNPVPKQINFESLWMDKNQFKY